MSRLSNWALLVWVDTVLAACVPVVAGVPDAVSVEVWEPVAEASWPMEWWW